MSFPPCTLAFQLVVSWFGSYLGNDIVENALGGASLSYMADKLTADILVLWSCNLFTHTHTPFHNIP